jgi:hypothetical protein
MVELFISGQGTKFWGGGLDSKFCNWECNTYEGNSVLEWWIEKRKKARLSLKIKLFEAIKLGAKY